MDFETGLINVRLNLVGEMLVLPWHGHGDFRRRFERKRRAVRLEGAEGDGSLKTVGGTHGVSPYGCYGKYILRAFFINQVGEAATPKRIDRKKHLPHLVNSSYFRAPTLELRGPCRR